MKIHLVGGFTGSGKTTAIEKACRVLNERNIKSLTIKENQCDYSRLLSQIELLKNTSNPSIVFVEYSGTCTDFATSLLEPLMEEAETDIETSNISTFTDAQLLLPYLRGMDIPLNAEQRSVWEQQNREAGILIVSKIDLLSDCQFEAMEMFAKDYFPSKQVVLLDSYDSDLVSKWIEVIGKSDDCADGGDVEHTISSEKAFAQLDEEIEISAKNNSAVELAYGFMTDLSNDIALKNFKTEHFQFFLSFNGQSSAISHKELLENNSAIAIPPGKPKHIDLVIYACVHTSPGELRKILYNRLNQLKSQHGVTIKEKFVSLI